jgi:protein O-GlcNAc transferase
MPTPELAARPADLLREAQRCEKSGDLAGAAALLDQALALHPDDPAALGAAARTAARRGDRATAILRLKRLVEVEPKQVAHRLDLAIVLYNAGDLAAAEAAVRELLAQVPRHGPALNLLGVLLRRQGQHKAAIEALEAAMRAGGAAESPWINLGNLYYDLRQGRQAVEAFKKAARLKPKDAEYARLLGNAHALAGETTQAFAALQRAALLNPRNPQIHADRAALHYNMKQYAEALPLIERALAARPGHLSDRINQAKILRHLGRLPEVIALFEALVQQYPENVEVLLAVGTFYLWTLDDREKANHYLRRAVTVEPGHLEALGQLCWSLLNSRYAREADHIEEAHRFACQALALDKPLLPIVDNLQTVFLRTADYERLDALGKPSELLGYWAANGKVGALHNQLGRVRTPADRHDLVRFHRAWGDRVVERARAVPIKRVPRATRASSKIRVGLMSSDLRDHPVTYFAQPILERYDRARFELYCYSFFPGEPDRVQTYLAAKVDQFRQMPAAAEPQIAQQIADDELDIVFELGGSTHLNKLEVMAYKPAPIQVSWLGYPHSCGLSTIDYILLDPYIRPDDPALLIERPFELPESWVALGSVGFHDVPIEPGLPEERAGHLTFGTMNNPYKYTPEIIALWARVLTEVPGSRFLFVRPEGGTAPFRDNLARAFAKHGIASDRIEFLPIRGKHLQHYNKIDISLDTAPHTGGTTTCETLWMGVPAVTLVGPAFFERLSYSNLSNAGLGDLCSFTPDDYVRIAVALAGDRARRLALRHGLRDQIRRLPLGMTDRWVEHLQRQIEMAVAAPRPG